MVAEADSREDKTWLAGLALVPRCVHQLRGVPPFPEPGSSQDMKILPTKSFFKDSATLALGLYLTSSLVVAWQSMPSRHFLLRQMGYVLGTPGW